MNTSYPNNGAASTDAAASTPTRTYTFSQKWGDDPFTALGHTQVPNALIENAARLGLAPEECWLIVCLLKFKHTPADPYPSQERLASLVGQSPDTVRRLLKRIERRGLMRVERVRGDLGHYTHSVYDFVPLRLALNEAYYQDHPQERPPAPVPLTTMQNCTVAPPRKIGRNHPAKSALTTVQICGPNKSLKENFEKENSGTLNVALGAPSQPSPNPQAGAQTVNGLPEGQRTLSRNEPQKAEPPAPTEAQQDEVTHTETPQARGIVPKHIFALAQAVVELTGDEHSRKRFEQLAGITDSACLNGHWKAAYTVTSARMHKGSTPLEKPGAYFNSTLARLLKAEGVYVPIGSKEERTDIRRQIRQSLASADAANGA